MKRQLVKLCHHKDIEPKVVSILLANEMVKLEDQSKGLLFANCMLTTKGKKALDVKTLQVNDEWLDKFRDLFPDHRRSSPKAIKDKMERFFMDNGVFDLDDIYDAARLYMKKLEDSRYCISADHFFYKFDKDGVMRSVCLQYLELIDDEDLDSEDYSGNIIL